MSVSKAIDAFNQLIVLNNDRIAAYKTAADEIGELDLSGFFLELAATSIECKHQLIAEVQRLDGTPNEEKTDENTVRVWLTIQPSLIESDAHAIVSFCEYGENVTLDTYKTILIQEVHEIKSAEQNILNNQYALLKADYEKLKLIHNVLKSEQNSN